MLVTETDTIWEAIRQEALRETARESMLASFFHAVVLSHSTLENALSFHLASKLASPVMSIMEIRDLIQEAFRVNVEIKTQCRRDLQAVVDRDPACKDYFVVILYYKGFQALQCYRVAHHYWNSGRKALALFLQSQISQAFSVDIHPAARIGSGILIDHATSIVIGETAVVDDDVSILHEVTLGGTGKQTGDRHPKVRSGALIGAGAKILGNIEIGRGSRIGAGSVVLHSVQEHTTVAGVPAKVVKVGQAPDNPALEMEQWVPSWEI